MSVRVAGFSIEKNNRALMDSQAVTYRGDTARLLVPGRVVSGCRLPQGTVSNPIAVHAIKGNIDVMQISVNKSESGRLDLEDRSKNIWSRDVHWVRAMRLAEDCHSYNVQLRKLEEQEGGVKLVLQVVRQIEVGQELLLWFSEDILAAMHMVFLTPVNIQGQKNYVCTHCSALYEYPNPLKLHLTLSCGRHPPSTLWENLSQTLTSETITSVQPTNEFSFQLTSQSPKQRIAIDLSAPPEKRIKQETTLYRPYNTTTAPQNYNSAFKPFQKTNENNNTQYWPRFFMPQDYVHAPMISNQMICEDQAQIETLVSSLGKLKEGHVCLYCGKSYSRKYGLKIHIRTHTGYKPLKCKFCLRPFGDPSNLNKHVRLHAEGDTPYKCELCGKVLVRRRDLERHLKSRHTHDMHPVANTTDEDSNDVSDEDKTIFVDK